MTDATTPDPRPHYARALRFAASVVDGVDPARLGDPTPCPEFDVRALLGHLVTTARRASTVGAGGDALTVPVVVTGPADDEWAGTYRAAAEEAISTWADDALLEKLVTVPWGTVPGAAAVWGYLNETLVHGWDLAVATGQPAEADPDLAEAVLAAAPMIIPAEVRGGPVPFAAPVAPREPAGPTERLANWNGHAV